jgi:hypothetical protein
MNDKEQEEIRQRLLRCIESGNFGMATPEQQAATGDYIDLDLIASLSKEQDDEE